MRARKNQNGQAIVELTVSLVGILAVFCGFLLISRLSIQNVDNIIKARGDADDNAINSRIADPGNSISGWSAGIDNNMYTADDTPNSVVVDPTPFSGELQNGIFSLKTDLSMSYIHDNYAPNVGNPDFIFISAAELTSGNYSSQPIQLDDLDRLLYVNAASITLKDESFMPFTSEN